MRYEIVLYPLTQSKRCLVTLGVSLHPDQHGALAIPVQKFRFNIKSIEPPIRTNQASREKSANKITGEFCNSPA